MTLAGGSGDSGLRRNDGGFLCMFTFRVKEGLVIANRVKQSSDDSTRL